MYLRRKVDIDVPKLISVIKKHECLWNTGHKDYNKRASMAVIRAWADVVDKVGKKGLTGSDLRSKWKNLKDAHRKDYKKNFINGEYQGQWQYFNDLDFLRPFINTTEKEKTDEPASDEEKNEVKIYHEGTVYKRKPDHLIIKLINEVQQHECLWNKDYFPVDKPSLRKSMLAWQDIAEKLGRPVNYVRRKWKNLRYSYRKETYKNYSNGEYRGIWQYFNMLSFLKIDYAENSGDEESEEDEEEHSQDNDSSEDSSSQNNDIQTQVKVEIEAIDNPLDYGHELHEGPVPAKRQRLDDEYDVMFLKSLVPFFRGMDPVRKLVLRSKIQDMVMNALVSPS